MTIAISVPLNPTATSTMPTLAGSPPVAPLPPHRCAEAAAARLLCRILLEDAQVRRRWQRHVLRSTAPKGALHQAAITRVLAGHLWEIGEPPASGSRSLKDRVNRMCAGRVTPQTLSWFIGAFDLSPTQATRLWDVLAGLEQDEPVARVG
ncbi:hypothetical protein [Ornithinimicrobium sp. Y1694]|uniref:hypothetical protein n=1 Tax=Ornithinimicrobium sp. Y1694 TaxID=3418590 RepID=UPI003CE780A8